MYSDKYLKKRGQEDETQRQRETHTHTAILRETERERLVQVQQPASSVSQSVNKAYKESSSHHRHSPLSYAHR